MGYYAVKAFLKRAKLNVLVLLQREGSGRLRYDIQEALDCDEEWFIDMDFIYRI